MSNNGSSPATLGDASRQNAYDCEIRTVANILETRQGNLRPTPGNITVPKPTGSPRRQVAKLDGSDTEPHINASTGQLTIRETGFTQGPSKPDFMSDQRGVVGVVESTTIIDEPFSQNDTRSSILDAIYNPTDLKVDEPISQKQPRASKSPSIRRKPIISQPEAVLPNSVPPPSEPFIPPSSAGLDISIITSTPLPSSISLDVLSSGAKSLEGKSELDNPTSKPSHFERQIQRPTGSLNDQEMPCAPIMRPTAEKMTPPGPVVSCTSRDFSGQSAAWSHGMSAAPKPLTPTSIKSGPSHDSPQDLFTPDVPAASLRPKSSFNVPELGKFSSADGSGTAFASSGHPQEAFKPAELGLFQNENGSGIAFPLQRHQQPAIETTELGRFPNEYERGKASTSPGSSEQIKYRPKLWRPGLSSDSNPFPLPTFPNDPSTTINQAKPSNMIMNDQTKPVFNPSQQVCFDQRSKLEDHLTGQTNNTYETFRANSSDPLGLASKIAQPFADFDGRAQSRKNISPDGFSIQVPSSNHPFDQQHLSSTESCRDVCQGEFVPPQTGFPASSSMQEVYPYDAAFDSSNQLRQEPHSLGSLEGPNDIVPKQLKPKCFQSGNPFNARRGLSTKMSHEQHEFALLGAQNGMIPNQLNLTDFQPGHSVHTRQDLPNMESHNQYAFRSSGSRKGMIPNQLESSGSKVENIKQIDSIFRQHTTNASSREQESFTGAHFDSRVDDDFRLAQIVANRTDYDELAALQRMQDEWNREEDLREAKQNLFPQRFQRNLESSPAPDLGHQQKSSLNTSQIAGSYPDLISWQPSRRDSVDSAQFAESPDADGAYSSIVFKAVKSTPAKPQRQRTLNLTSEKAIMRERQEQEPRAPLEKEKAGRAPAKAKNQVECTVCRDSEDKSRITTLPCNHAYHPLCLASAFQHALASSKLFICCDKTPAPIDLAAPYLPAQFVTNYKAKMVERSTPNPIYCAKPGCATFIPLANLTGPMATCPKCGFVTCSLCKNPEHKGVCPPDMEGKKLLKLASNRKWTQCQRCKSMVERDEGCLHMTCTCGHEFCYSCGGKWEDCKRGCTKN